MILMASLRSLGLLALVPAAAATPVIAASSQRRRLPAQKGVGEGVLGIGARGGLLLQPTNRGSSLLSRRSRSGRASSLLLLLASSATTSAMGVSDATAVAEEEKSVIQSDGADLLTEFMVKMSCGGCVESVRKKLEPLEGVKSVDVDLATQVVRILGSASVGNLRSAIEQTGRDARLIGQGLPSNFAVAAAVAEFKGPEVHGVVRFAQVTIELARIDASFSGLTPGSHAWSINSYGDLTRGAASTGGILESESPDSAGTKNKPLGDLGTLDVNGSGETDYAGTKAGLQVSDLIGRAVVLYDNEDNSRDGITAAVIARSAGVGQNYKSLCSCDGTVIWESTNNDFVKL